LIYPSWCMKDIPYVWSDRVQRLKVVPAIWCDNDGGRQLKLLSVEKY
jgi:hypothetical protein